MERNRRKVLEEAERIRLEEYCLNELNDMVDYRTGEIMSSRGYVSLPMVWEDRDPISPPFGEISSYSQMQRFMGAKDKRRLSRFNGCRAIYDLDKGRAFLERKRHEFPTPALHKLSRLVERLDYMNAIVTTPEELSDWVGVRHTNLHRHLQSLGGLIRIRGPREGMSTGSIKVEVSPVYGFRYESASLSYAQEKVRELWYEQYFIQRLSAQINADETGLCAA